MDVINKRIEDVKPYENNPRKNDAAVQYVANSIREFGFKQPIVIDRNGVIVAGHTRYKAAIELGLEEVPCIMAYDLTDEQVKAYRLADNKVAEASEWNLDLLNKELDDLFNEFDMADFGFNAQIENIDLKPLGIKGEMEFAKELGEANNYCVLEFSTVEDWEKAKIVFGLDDVITSHPNEKMRKIGVGRVIDGKKVMERLMGDEH